MLAIDNNEESQCNHTLAISDIRHNNCNIRNLIDFKMIERQDLFIQYSVPYKRSFWLFVSVKKIMLLEFLKSHTLRKHPNNVRWWIIRLQHIYIICHPLRMVIMRLHNPVNHPQQHVHFTHRAVLDSHCGDTRGSAEITHAVIIASRTHIQ